MKSRNQKTSSVAFRTTAKELRAIISTVCKYKPDVVGRFFFDHVCTEWTDTAALYFVASDSHTLVYVTLATRLRPSGSARTNPSRVTIPRQTWLKALKAIPRTGSLEVLISFKEDFTFSALRIESIFHTILYEEENKAQEESLRFPNWRDVVPSQKDMTAAFIPAGLQSWLEEEEVNTGKWPKRFTPYPKALAIFEGGLERGLSVVIRQDAYTSPAPFILTGIGNHRRTIRWVCNAAYLGRLASCTSEGMKARWAPDFPETRPARFDFGNQTHVIMPVNR